MIYRYLDCGDLHNGFAHVKCNDCGHEYILAFSCKRGMKSLMPDEAYRIKNFKWYNAKGI